MDLFTELFNSINNVFNYAVSYIMNDMLPNIVYYLIYYYSKIEMFFIQMNRKYNINEGIEDIEYFELIKDGKVAHKIVRDEWDNITDNLLDVEYDFIIYTKNKDKVILNSYQSVVEYEKAGYKFVLVEIIYPGSVSIEILFSNEKYNYLIVNNVFDNKFITYFLKEHYLNDITRNNIENINEYSNIRIIDDNINIHELLSSQNITILKDKFITI